MLSSIVVLEKAGRELNDNDSEQIFWKALGDAAKKNPGKPLKSADVLRAGDARAAEFFQQPFSNYLLVASLSMKKLPAKRITLGESVITPLKERGKRYPLPDVLKSVDSSHIKKHLDSSSYQLVRINTKGRSIFEAVNLALEDLSLLRALWSFSATLGKRTIRLDGGPRRPIGVIHSGPLYTLHNPDGSSANDNYYWFDPSYIGDLKLFDHEDQFQRIEKDRKRALRKIHRLPYGADIKKLFLRYIAALDQPDPNVAFLQLWSILENITDTTGRRYEDTIKRACWIYSKESKPVVKEMLEALRHHRNRYVHSEIAMREREEITYHIKSFVDPHLIRLLHNTFKVQSIQEYGELLSYPTNIESLEKIRDFSLSALRMSRKESPLCRVTG